MRKLYAATIAGIMGITALYAQQDPQFSHNMFNRLAVNPGYAGSQGSLCLTALGRNQWNAFAGQPNTGLISADMPLAIAHGGVGVTIYADKLGNERSFSGKLAYAYRHTLAQGTLGIGADIGLMNKAVQGTWTTPDGTPSTADPSIPQGNSATAPDFSFGLYYSSNSDKLWVGLSTTHVAANSLKNGSLNYLMKRHYYVMAGYKIEPTPALSIKPSLLVKSDAASTQVDLNLLAEYNSQFWGGLSYRLQDAVVALVGVKFNTFRVGYSYDITTSKVRGYSNGTHEIMVGYCFKPAAKAPTQKHHNVRFL
jgi:type IX secretion system PorP/SprF family membrane protein